MKNAENNQTTVDSDLSESAGSLSTKAENGKWTRTDGGVKAYVKRVNRTIEVEISHVYEDQWLVVVLHNGSTAHYEDYKDICPEPNTPNGYHRYRNAKAYGTRLAKALAAANFTG
jgi:hypothetical protein